MYIHAEKHHWCTGDDVGRLQMMQILSQPKADNKVMVYEESLTTSSHSRDE